MVRSWRVVVVLATVSFCGGFTVGHAAAARHEVAVAPPAAAAGIVPNALKPDREPVVDTPTPAPTPVPPPPALSSPVAPPAVAPVPPSPVAPPRPATPRPIPAPPVRHNWLTSGDGSLNTGVGIYDDCSGRTVLTHAAAAIDTCVSGPVYFVGHNAGVFTPLMHMGTGSIITYYDGDAVAHVWRVVSVRPNWRAADGAPPPTGPDVVAQFQTCAVPDGSVDRILDVVPA
jgi:hypothetical protein